MLASRQQTVFSVRRDAWVEVDLGVIEKNQAIVRSFVDAADKDGKNKRVRLMAVVKSDAYGHGAVAVSEVLVAAGAEWLAVASVDEGCQLRAAEIKAPILILSPVPAWAFKTAIENDLNLTVTSVQQARELGRAAKKIGRNASVNIKIDSGMHRLGVTEKELPELLDEIEKSGHLDFASVFTHLAMASHEEPTRRQSEAFKRCLALVLKSAKKPHLVHAASSEASRLFPFTHHDMVRVGLYLYGLEPNQVSDFLVPAMSVKGRINHIQEIEAGDRAGYNFTWTARRPSRLASIPIGYADGVDRGLSNKMNGLIQGAEVPQVGLISMDQMLFDITDVPQAQVGDVITLIGSESARPREKTLYLAQWAQTLETITYELACRLRVRLPRVYTRRRTPSTLREE